jgi:type VI secretion system secreted protein Hcp
MAFDAFLKIDGIPGESNDSKHKDEIEVLSFSFGISRQNERGRPSIADFSIVKTVDTASPLLFDAACQGDSIKSALFTARKAGEKQQEFIKITFEEVIISSVQHSGAPGTDGVPMESVSLDFRSLEMEVFKQKEDGSIGGSTKTVCTSRRGGP